VPLNKKKTKKAQSSNIAKLMAEGYPQKRAVAISYSVMEPKKKKGKKDAEGNN